MRLSFAAIAAMGLMSACQPSGTSETKVVNGKNIQETEEPAVRQLYEAHTGGGGSTCTGTFLTAETLLTAAHCVNPTKAEVNFVFAGNRQIPASRVFVHPLYAAQYAWGEISAAGPYDLAILVFPSGTSSATKELRRIAPKAKEEFKTVGYGRVKQRYNSELEKWEGSGSPVNPQTGRSFKTTGTNVIRQVTNGMIRWLGVTGYESGLQPGQDISVGSGDSGGPLIIDDKLAGIASYVSVGQGLDPRTNQTVVRNGSNYVDITSSESVNFFRSVAQAGVTIPGFSTPPVDVQLTTTQSVERMAPGSPSPYTWTVKVHGEIEKVSCVIYRLDRTFKPNDVVSSCNRAENFAITRQGWGGFTIVLDVVLLDGTTLASKLKHKLDLTVAQPSGPKADDFKIVQGLSLAQAPDPFSPAAPIEGNVPWDLWIVADDSVKNQVKCVTYSFPTAAREPVRLCGAEQSRAQRAFAIEGEDDKSHPVSIKVELTNGQELTLAHSLVLKPVTWEIFNATSSSCEGLGLELEVIREDLSRSPVARAPQIVRTCRAEAVPFPGLRKFFQMIIVQGINYAMPMLND